MSRESSDDIAGKRTKVWSFIGLYAASKHRDLHGYESMTRSADCEIYYNLNEKLGVFNAFMWNLDGKGCRQSGFHFNNSLVRMVLDFNIILHVLCTVFTHYVSLVAFFVSLGSLGA